MSDNPSRLNGYKGCRYKVGVPKKKKKLALVYFVVGFDITTALYSMLKTVSTHLCLTQFLICPPATFSQFYLKMSVVCLMHGSYDFWCVCLVNKDRLGTGVCLKPSLYLSKVHKL